MSSTEQTAIPALSPRERLLILAELSALTALSWLYLVRMPMSATDFGAVVVRLAAPLSPGLVNFWLAFMMWAVMMVAMMLPGAAPMILMYARIARSREDASAAGQWAFAGGYVVIWTMFSAAATVTQSALQHFAFISNGLSTAPIVSATILVGAGVYQLTSFKHTCLGHCQSPVAFFMTHWRAGTASAFRMGLAHGAFCVGCCWMLMALLFAVGVMNLAWVAALSAFVLLEKLMPYPQAIARSTGAVMIACGFLLTLHN
jgi:predicted metal-binding membrane protein